MTYVLGGMEVENNDTGTVEIRNGVYTSDVLALLPAFANFLIPAGTVLARLNATGTLVVFEKAGILGAEIPKAILSADVQLDATPSPANIRVLVSGVVRLSRLIGYTGLIPQPPGDPTYWDLATRDLIRTYTMISLETLDLSELDNQ